jgi:NitT/TauT family transport system substrate-binding protein
LSPGTGTAYLEYAVNHGIFSKYGIDLKLQYFLNGGNEGNAAIASGQIDAGSYGPPVLTAIVRGLKIKIIGSPSDSISDGSILAAGPSIKTVEDLKGKIVATTTKGMSPYQHAFTILEHHGLSAADVNFRPANGNIGVQLLKSGQADASILGELDLGLAKRLGFAHPLDTSGKYLGAYQSNFFFASQRFIDEHPAELQSLVKALYEANAFAENNFEGYLSYVMKKYTQIYDTADVRLLLQKNLRERNKNFTVYPYAVRQYLNYMVKWEDFKPEEVSSLSDERLFDLRFIKTLSPESERTISK